MFMGRERVQFWTRSPVHNTRESEPCSQQAFAGSMDRRHRTRVSELTPVHGPSIRLTAGVYMKFIHHEGRIQSHKANI